MNSIIEVKDLSLEIGSKKILSDISFSLEKSSFTAICGRNGAGKSQLLRILKGLRKPTNGNIYIKGEDVTKNKNKRLK